MKELRLRRLRNPETGRVVICPMDHGITLGPIKGLTDLEWAVERVKRHVDAVVVHKGQIPAVSRQLRDHPEVAVLVHLNASVQGASTHPAKVLVAGVEEAAGLGADGVSVQLNLGCEGDSAMLQTVGQVTREARLLGLPVLAMTYPQPPGMRGESADDIVHVARAAAELGADLVKVSMPVPPDQVARVVAGTGVPVVVSGGPYRDDRQALLAGVRLAMEAGASGVALGRNVFQDEDPRRSARELYAAVHGPTRMRDFDDMVPYPIPDLPSKPF